MNHCNDVEKYVRGVDKGVYKLTYYLPLITWFLYSKDG